MGRLRDRVREAEERLAGLTRALQSAYDEELSEALAAHDDAARGLNRAKALQHAARLLSKPDLAARFDEVVATLREAEAEARGRVEQLRAVERELGNQLSAPPPRPLLAAPEAVPPAVEAEVARPPRPSPPPSPSETRAPPRPPPPPPEPVAATDAEEVDLEDDEPSSPVVAAPAVEHTESAVVPAAVADHEEAELLSFATGKTGPQRVSRPIAELPTRAPPPPPPAPEAPVRPPATTAAAPAPTPIARMKPTTVPAAVAKAPVPHIASTSTQPDPAAPSRSRPPTTPPHAPATTPAELKAKLVALESRYEDIAKMLPRLEPEESRLVLQEQLALVRLVEQRCIAAGGDGPALVASALARLSAFAGQSHTPGLIGLDRANEADWTRLATEAKAARQRLVAARRPRLA